MPVSDLYDRYYIRGNKKQMDLSIIQKISELNSEGRSTDEIRQELRTGGASPESIEQALREAGVQVGPSVQQAAPQASAEVHHEKIIQPSPGFDPNAK
jgi:hypothetical protein